jgi:hypothetical protein
MKFDALGESDAIFFVDALSPSEFLRSTDADAIRSSESKNRFRFDRESKDITRYQRREQKRRRKIDRPMKSKNENRRKNRW